MSYKVRDTYLLAHDPALKKKIEEGLKDIRAGRTMSLDAYANQRKRLKSKPAQLAALVARQKKALRSIIGIGASGFSNISREHDAPFKPRRPKSRTRSRRSS